MNRNNLYLYIVGTRIKKQFKLLIIKDDFSNLYVNCNIQPQRIKYNYNNFVNFYMFQDNYQLNLNMEKLLPQNFIRIQNGEQLYYEIIIFVNTESGGKLGKRIIQSKIKSLEFDQYLNSRVHFFMINHQVSLKNGLKMLNQLISLPQISNKKFLVLAGGGDGTVNWLLSQLIKQKFDFDKFIFSTFPLGTGNDFARHLGWQQLNIFDNQFQGLKKFIKLMKQGEEHNFDVWDVKVQSYEDGNIKKKMQNIGQASTKQLQVQQIKKITTINKTITNYFSFGMDARVGYDFDKHRSKNQLANYILYCLIGCFNRFRSIPSMHQMVQQMQEVPTLENQKGLLIFQSKNQSVVTLKEDYRNIVALNINSYMGGVSNIWNKTNKTGLKNVQSDENKFTNSIHSDGMLEFVAFSNEWSLGFQRYFRGRARKIAQSEGPIRFKFDGATEFTYINFDGEYYKIRKPKQILIQKSKYFTEKKLKVLIRKGHIL